MNLHKALILVNNILRKKVFINVSVY